MKQHSSFVKIKTHPTLLKKFSMLFLIIFVLVEFVTTVKGNNITSNKVEYEHTGLILTIPADYYGLRGASCGYDTRPVTTGQATAIDNCDNSAEITYTDVLVIGTECNKVIARTWKAVDNCGNSTTGIQTLTYIDDTDPVLIVPADYNGLRGAGCEYDTRPVTTGKATATDNCDKSVEVTYTDVFAPSSGCETVITRTWKAVDNCGNSATGIQTITYTDYTDPVLIIPPDYNGFASATCEFDTRPVNTGQATATGNCDKSVEVTYTDVFAPSSGCETVITRTWKAVDACGHSVTAIQTLRFSDDIEPIIVLYNDETEYTFEGCDMLFRLPKPTATDNCDGNVILKAYVGSTEIDLANYKFENEGITIVTFTATDQCGNSGTSTVTVNREPCRDLSHCTYTQERYGNRGGSSCAFIDGVYQKTDALTMMKAAFGDRPSVIFGDLSAGKYFELMSESISNTEENEGIFQMLPGAGTPAALIGPANSLDKIGRTAGRWVNVPRSTYKPTMGMIMNNLLCQTITLFFNMENDESLGDFELSGRYLVTAKSTDCGSEYAVPNSSSYVEIPQSVLDYFKANGMTGTINELYVLANKLLGGFVVSPTVSLSAAAAAVDAVNRAFDGCRILIEFSSTVPGVPKASSVRDIGATISESKDFSEVTLTVSPNPFARVVKFEVEMVYDSHVRIDIFNHSGTLLKVILNEDLNQGDVRTVEFDATAYPHSAFLYRVTTDVTLLNGIIMKTK